MLRFRAAFGLAALAVATAGPVVLPGVARAATPTVTEFSQGISADSNPFGIAAGPDGNLWFTDEEGRIGRITPLGTVTEFSAGISAGSFPREIAAGPDGNLWFTEHLANKIGRITQSGTVTEFGGLMPNSYPWGIAAGPDGNLWFTESSGDRIGRITPAGTVTEFSAGISPDSNPKAIAAGPDGNLWFTESDGNRIGRITPSGTVTEFSAGISPGSVPRDIAAGPDGNLWFTEYDSHRVAKITPSGTVTEFSGLSPGSFPAAIAAGPDGNLWVAEFAGDGIARITPSGTVTEFSSGITGSGLQDIASGPDGNLWFTEFFDSRIGRITTALDTPAHVNAAPISVPGVGTSGPASPYPSEIAVAGAEGTVTDVRVRLTAISQPPVAVAQASPTSGDVGLTVAFDGSGSSDPNGDPLTYAWDLDGDGAFDDSGAVRPSWTYNAAGSYRASLQVSDGRGATATDAVTIGVGRPDVTIQAPAATVRWAVNDTVSFSGSATDNQGVAIPASDLTWRLVLKHGACPDCHEHFLQTYSGVATGSFNTPDHDYPSELELSLTATDARGLSNSTSVRLLPRTTTLTFATSPTGLKLTFNGVSATAPFSKTVIVGSANSLSAPTPQNQRGKQIFRTWSDGVATAIHPPITAPESPATYTATFSKR